MGSVAFFVPHAGCPQDCSFCNQRTISGQERPPTPKEVTATLQKALENLGEKAPLTEIAFFGGSFTAVEPSLREGLLQAAAPFCGKDMFAGIRFSTRPDAISKEILDNLRQYPVHHIELGAQSMDDTVLCRVTRGHTAEDIRQAAALLHQYGYGMTLQMMTGLPGDTPAGTMETARQLAQLQPKSVRIYPTLTLEGTLLEQEYRRGEYHPPTLEETVALGAKLLLLFEQEGIDVIRMGLQASEGLRGQVLAGPYHPALRELCIGRALANLAEAERIQQEILPEDLVLTVSPHHLSALTGHGRVALSRWEAGGERVTVQSDVSLPKGLILRVTAKSTS